MKRRLLNLLTLLSLLLLVAVAALWVRSHWYFDQISFTNDDGDGYILCSGGVTGGVEWSVRRVMGTNDSGRRLNTFSARPGPWWTLIGRIHPTRLGFGADRLHVGVVTSQCVKEATTPAWSLPTGHC